MGFTTQDFSKDHILTPVSITHAKAEHQAHGLLLDLILLCRGEFFEIGGFANSHLQELVGNLATLLELNELLFGQISAAQRNRYWCTTTKPVGTPPCTCRIKKYEGEHGHNGDGCHAGALVLAEKREWRMIHRNPVLQNQIPRAVQFNRAVRQ